MNKERRKAILKALDEFSELVSKLEEIKTTLETARDEEQDYYDNMPESLQGSEKGEQAQSAIEQLDAIITGLDEAINLEQDFNE